jgi:rubrerythrin
MDELRRQVRHAQRRLILQQLLSAVLWSLFIALTVAALGIAIRKIWPLPVDGELWMWSWIAGAVVVGLLTAGFLTFLRRHRALDAAVEIDRRFGLKERVSSCLSLTDDERHSQAGQALTDDAIRRVVQVEVPNGFRIAAGRWAWLPLAAAIVVFALTLLSDAKPDAPAKAQAATVTAKQRVHNSTKILKKKLEQRRQQAAEKGLEEAGDLFKKIERGMDDLAKKEDVNRQKALVKLNDLVQDIKQRQQQLGSKDDLRKQLNHLKDLSQGPADRMAQAIKDGDFRSALGEVKKLEEQLRKNELSEEEKQKLKQQLEQMRDKLQQLAAGHSQAKRDLEEQIKQKLSQGDREAAGKLQRQLDRLVRQDQQMERLSQMAQQLNQCSQCLQSGRAQDAAQQLSDLAAGLEQLQEELEEWDMLEDVMNEIADTKDAMACPHCRGMG